MGLHKNKKYKLNPETADTALKNVLAACDKPPNTVPSDKLMLRQKLNTYLHNRPLILTAALLALAFLVFLGIILMTILPDRQGIPEPVALISDYVEDGSLYLELSGDNILYEEAWMSAIGGEQIPGIYDESTGLISFPFPDSGEYNIYIPVKHDDPFQLLLTLYK